MYRFEHLDNVYDLFAMFHTSYSQIHRIMGICLGIPPTKFSFQYYDKNEDIVNKCKTVGPITPLEFYKQYIKLDCFDMDDMVNQLFTLNFMGSR